MAACSSALHGGQSHCVLPSNGTAYARNLSSALQGEPLNPLLCGQSAVSTFPFYGIGSSRTYQDRAPLKVSARKQTGGEDKKSARPADLNRLREDLLKEKSAKGGRRDRDYEFDDDDVAERRGFPEERRNSRYDESGGRGWQERRGGNGGRYGGQGSSRDRDSDYAGRGGRNGARWDEDRFSEGRGRASYGGRRGGPGRFGRGGYSQVGQRTIGRGQGSGYGSDREGGYREESRYGGGDRLSGGYGAGGRGRDSSRGGRGSFGGRGLVPAAGRTGALALQKPRPMVDFSEDEDEYEEDESDYEEDDDELPPDTFVMKDAQGEEVVVFGHEGLDPSQLTQEMLTWTPIQIETETTKDGNMEEEDWWKLLEGDRYVGDWKAPWAKKGDDEDEDEDDEEDEDDVAVEEIDEETAVKLFGKEGAARLFAGEDDEDIYFEVEEEIDDETGETVEVYEVKEVGRVKIDPSGAIDTIVEPAMEEKIVAGPSKDGGVKAVLSGGEKAGRDDNEASVNSSVGEESTSGAGARSHQSLGASGRPEVEAVLRKTADLVSEELSTSSGTLAASDESVSDAEEETSESGSFLEDGSDGESDGEWSGQAPFRVFGKTFGRKRRLGALPETTAEPVRASEVIGSLNDEWRRVPAAKAPADVSTSPGAPADVGATSGPSADVSTTSGPVGDDLGHGEIGTSDGSAAKAAIVGEREGSQEAEGVPVSVGNGGAKESSMNGMRMGRTEFREAEDAVARVGALAENLAGMLDRLNAADVALDSTASALGSISEAILRNEVKAEESRLKDSSETPLRMDSQESSSSVWLDKASDREGPSTSPHMSESDSPFDDDVSRGEGPAVIRGEETQAPGPPKKSKKELRKEAAQVPHLGSGRSNYERDLAEEFFSKKSFTTAGASEDAAVALAAMGVLRPSHIQALAFQPVLTGTDCIIADQTGSGKTLAYLAPIAQRLRQEEAAGARKAAPTRPKVLVLTPTSELAAQVLTVARSLSMSGVPFRSIVVTGGYKWKTQVDALEAGAEVVIATPGRLVQHLEKETLCLDDVKTIVVDEVDVLFDDDDFGEFLRPLRARAPQLAQYVFVTATLPLDVHERLLAEFPFATSVLGPNLHTTASGLTEVLVDCSGGDEISEESGFERKKDALLQIVGGRPRPRERATSGDDDEWDFGRERSARDRRESRRKSGSSTAKKTLVFCNKIETCRKVENALRRRDRGENDFEVLAYHAALSADVRQANMQRFLRPVGGPGSKPLVLVCTDRASRGVDSADVEQVVLFDFPREPSEYVRRVGRTARGAGGTGTVYVLVLGRQVAIARKILDRNERGEPVHQVPAAII